MELHCSILPHNFTKDFVYSETISEGEARLAYRPRDENFLNLKKGDVVLVKSKNAGKKTHLWGGQVGYLLVILSS